MFESRDMTEAEAAIVRRNIAKMEHASSMWIRKCSSCDYPIGACDYVYSSVVGYGGICTVCKDMYLSIAREYFFKAHREYLDGLKSPGKGTSL